MIFKLAEAAEEAGAVSTVTTSCRRSGPGRSKRIKRRIGILMTIAANDPEAQARIVVFAQALQALGWTDGRNARSGAMLETG